MKDNINMVITVAMRSNGKNGRKKTERVEYIRDSRIHFKICKIILKFDFHPHGSCHITYVKYMLLPYYALVIGILKFYFYFY